jgi:hypothetical protein
MGLRFLLAHGIVDAVSPGDPIEELQITPLRGLDFVLVMFHILTKGDQN